MAWKAQSTAVKIPTSPSTKSDTELRLPVHLGKVVLENRFGHVDRGENVGDQTDGQGDGETADRPGAKKEQEERGNDRRNVRVDDGQERLVESRFDSGCGRLTVA